MGLNTASPVSDEEKRQALERVLSSRTFARAEQLRALLQYLCKAEAEGRHHELSEYVIGREVLGRPEDFSPLEDSSVRTRAYELRQKLEKFYLLEAPDAPVRIVLPKGTYVPRYERITEPKARNARAAGHSGQAAPISRGRVRQPRWVWWPLVASAVLAVVGVSSLLLASRRNADADVAVVREAWGPLLEPGANVLICVATPLHLTVGPDTHQAFGSPIYPAPKEAYPIWRQHRPLAPGAKLGMVFTDNVVGFGTIGAVLAAANTLRTFGVSYQILPERVAPFSTFRNRNVMLFGAPVDSDAVTRCHENTPLLVDYEPSVREFVIRDRQTGRMLVPRKDPQGEFLDVYGLVTVLNNREGERSKLGMVLFSGITSAGTHGAAEFFATPSSLLSLRERFRRQGIRGFPTCYQVIVRCTFSKALLASYDYVDHKVIER